MLYYAVEGTGEALPRVCGTEIECGLINASKEPQLSRDLEKVITNLPTGVEGYYTSKSSSFLSNGMRLYVDVGTNLEVTTCEVIGVENLVPYELAAEELVVRAIRKFNDTWNQENPDEQKADIRQLMFAKLNIDSQNNSFGHHENYLTDRRINQSAMRELLISHFVTRILFTGDGGLVKGYDGEQRYVLSQRMEHIHDTVSASSTRSRPLFHTRDEPHADKDHWMRIHNICGNANISPWAIGMTAATTSLVLRLQEAAEEFDISELMDKIVFTNPVMAARHISQHPIHENPKFRMADGKERSAREVQDLLIEYVNKLEQSGVVDLSMGEKEMLGEWIEWRDDDRAGRDLSDRVDHIKKRELIDELLEKKKLNISDGKAYNRVKMFEMLYSLGRDDKLGIGRRLRSKGLFRRMPSLHMIEGALQRGAFGRARARGDKILRKETRDTITSVGWDAITYHGKQTTKLSPFVGTEYEEKTRNRPKAA